MAIFILFTSKWQKIKFCLIQKMSIIYYKSPKIIAYITIGYPIYESTWG